MIKSIYFPGKEYATKELLFADLRVNASRIIETKKADVQKSFEKGFIFDGFLLPGADDVTKVGPHMKDGYIYAVINTTNYLDSHQDVHFPSLWNKSIKDNAGKLYYVADHEIKLNTVIAWPEDVNAMVKTVPWAFVGKSYEGNTEALIYEIDKTKIVNKTAAQIIAEKRPVQNSVRMMYVKIKLAMNSDNPLDAEAKTYFDTRINEIANKQDALDLGYFFGVEEAKIIKEGSMVINGSNDATPIRQKYFEPVDTTQTTIEPPGGTQKTETIFINPNFY